MNDIKREEWNKINKETKSKMATELERVKIVKTQMRKLGGLNNRLSIGSKK